MIGEKIKKFRLAKGLKQSELAQMVHVSQNTISYWESGRTDPNIGAVELLCRALDCKKSDLLDFSPEIENASGDMFIKISFDQNKKPSVSFVSGELSENETVFLERYRSCDDETKELLNRIISYQIELKKKKDSE